MEQNYVTVTPMYTVVSSVCISVPLWQIRIFGLLFHAKSGYPDFIRIYLCRSV